MHNSQLKKQMKLTFWWSGTSVVVTGSFQSGMELAAFAFLEIPDPSLVVRANEEISRRMNCCAQGRFHTSDSQRRAIKTTDSKLATCTGNGTYATVPSPVKVSDPDMISHLHWQRNTIQQAVERAQQP